MKVTSTISVSREDELDCNKVAEYMASCGIITSITSNMSFQSSMENGCRLRQTIESKFEVKNIWHILKNKYNFNCAHVYIPGIYTGCILDYLKPSVCSGNCND